MKKICFKCLAEKDISCFYRHPRMGDGYLNKCIDCAKKDTLSNRSKNKDYYYIYDRLRANNPDRVERRIEYRKSVKGKEILANGKRRWALKNKDKISAQIKARQAITRGDLVVGCCEICGCRENIEAHHEDYHKPLDVRWLCIKHHAERHVEIRSLSRVFPEIGAK
jgi:hypothetical protein